MVGRHYTCDVLHTHGRWLRFDDTTVSLVSSEQGTLITNSNTPLPKTTMHRNCRAVRFSRFDVVCSAPAAVQANT